MDATKGMGKRESLIYKAAFPALLWGKVLSDRWEFGSGAASISTEHHLPSTKSTLEAPLSLDHRKR